jgi:hypothetical protein
MAVPPTLTPARLPIRVYVNQRRVLANRAAPVKLLEA